MSFSQERQERYNELETMFADATLDNAQDCIEWLIYVQDFAHPNDTLEAVLQRLFEHTGQKLYIRSGEPIENEPANLTLDEETKPFAKIFAMFQKAKDSGLDWPKIVLGGELNLTLSMNAKGVINITNGERYGTPSNVWYGRISPPNTAASKNAYMFLRENLPSGDKGEVQQHIKDFDTDPAKAARLYGLQTGSCMFCARKLTNAVSVTVGYGPICAMNFGLPHDGIIAKNRKVEVPIDSGLDDDIPF